MQEGLLALLRCPCCRHRPLGLYAFGLLHCAECTRCYPVREGIATLLPDDLLTPEDATFLAGWRDLLPSRLAARASAAPEHAPESAEPPLRCPWSPARWWSRRSED